MIYENKHKAVKEFKTKASLRTIESDSNRSGSNS